MRVCVQSAITSEKHPAIYEWWLACPNRSEVVREALERYLTGGAEGGAGLSGIEARLARIEERLTRIEAFLREGDGEEKRGL